MPHRPLHAFQMVLAVLLKLILVGRRETGESLALPTCRLYVV